MRWINPKLNIDGEELRMDSPLQLCFIGTTAAILAGTLAGVGGSAASGAIGAHAAGSAAKTQADATVKAAQLQKDTADKSLGLQKDMFDKGQANIAPWLDAGRQGLMTMSDLLSTPGQGLLKGYDKEYQTPGSFFGSPEAAASGYKGPVTDADVKSQFDPGFQYRMDLSNKAIQSLAASKGLLDSGGTAMKLIRNAQDLGSQEYENAFGRATTLNNNEYGQGFNAYNANNKNALDAFNTNENTYYKNQADQFSRLATLSGMGQSAADTSVAAGSNFANSSAATSQSATQGINEANTSGAAATAAGDVGAANSWTSALSNIGKYFTNFAPMQAIFGGGDLSRQFGRNMTNQQAQYNFGS